MTGAEAFTSAGRALVEATGCVVRYRDSLSGRAHLRDPGWLIEVPRPTTAMRFFIFAHEVGHQERHRAGANRAGLPPLRELARWEQEVEADEYAADCFADYGLPGLRATLTKQEPYLAWTAYKSLRHARDPRVTLARIEERVAAGPCAAMIPAGLPALLRQHMGDRAGAVLGG